MSNRSKIVEHNPEDSTEMLRSALQAAQKDLVDAQRRAAHYKSDRDAKEDQLVGAVYELEAARQQIRTLQEQLVNQKIDPAATTG